VELLVKIAGRSKVLCWHLCRAFFNRERLSVVGVRRAERRVSAATSQSPDVTRRPRKVKEAAGCIRVIRGRGWHASKVHGKISDDAAELSRGFLVKSSQVDTLPKAKSETRSKQNKDMHKCSSVYSERGVPLPVLTSGGE
jgi:hypothetical protein